MPADLPRDDRLREGEVLERVGSPPFQQDGGFRHAVRDGERPVGFPLRLARAARAMAGDQDAWRQSRAVEVDRRLHAGDGRASQHEAEIDRGRRVLQEQEGGHRVAAVEKRGVPCGLIAHETGPLGLRSNGIPEGAPLPRGG